MASTTPTTQSVEGLSPETAITKWSDSFVLRGLPEFLSDVAAVGNLGEVDAEGRQQLRDFLSDAIPLVLKWDGYIRAGRTATVDDIHREAGQDAAVLNVLLQKVDQRRIGGRKFVEERLDDLLGSTRHAPLFWAWRTRDGVKRKNRFNPARTLRGVLENPKQGLLANYLGARGMIPATARLTWRVIGERFRERGIVPVSAEHGSPGFDPTFHVLPTSVPSVVLALRSFCWKAAEQAWRRGPQDPETATLALHALCVGMTDSDMGRDQARDTLTHLGPWCARLMEAGADADRPYAYRYGSINPPRPPKTGMLLPKGTDWGKKTSPITGVRHGEALGVTASAMALAYTPGLVVTAYIEQRREEHPRAKVPLDPAWEQAWLEAWAARWKQHPPRLSFREQDPDNPSNALFDAWLAGDNGRPHSKHGDYILAGRVLEQWGRVLGTHDQAPWVDRTARARAWPWGVREALIAVAGAPQEKEIDRKAKPTALLDERMIALLDLWMPQGRTWPVDIFIEATQSVVGSLAVGQMDVRQDQWAFLEAMAHLLPPEEHDGARTYLNSLKEAQDEFLSRPSNDPDIKKRGLRTLFKSHKERMILRACGPLQQHDISRPNKMRTL